MKPKEIDWNKELNEARIKLCKTHKMLIEQNKRIKLMDKQVDKLKENHKQHLLSLWDNYLILTRKIKSNEHR